MILILKNGFFSPYRLGQSEAQEASEDKDQLQHDYCDNTYREGENKVTISSPNEIRRKSRPDLEVLARREDVVCSDCC